MIVEELINMLQHQNPKAKIELGIFYDDIAEFFHADQMIHLDVTEPNIVEIKASA